MSLVASSSYSSSAPTHRPLRKTLDSPQHYTAAWLTALPLERAASQMMLDEEHGPPRGFSKSGSDSNHYTWGKVSGHNVVIASLPAGEYGTNTTAATAEALRASLPHIRIGLLVGIGAGVPSREVQLGDVVVSQPDRTSGGVVQYDLYKAKEQRERKGFLNAPPRMLRSALSALQAAHEIEDSRINEFMQVFRDHPKMRTTYGFPGDQLRAASIHYGTIASGNVLIKTAVDRDSILEFLRDVDPLCFEMEAAGLMNSFPCLVIRGICDYADEHKNDRWQRYAAATAAAFAKELLTFVDVIDSPEVRSRGSYALDSKLTTVSGATFDSYDDRTRCLDGTRVELLKRIDEWSHTGGKIFWLCGKAGTGKSTVACTAAHMFGDRLGASFFFKRGEGDRGRATHFFPTLAKQLADRVPLVRDRIATALDQDSLICERNLRAQFERLIRPLLLPQGLVLVIDALDECEGNAQSALIDMLSQLDIRVLITSRPDVLIEDSFSKLSPIAHHDVQLEDASDIRQDLKLFLSSQLTDIRMAASAARLRPISNDWPGSSLAELVDMADPLFVVAATICRFISGRKPEQRLRQILADRTLSGIDAFYLQILRSAEALDPAVLGIIATLFDPLDIDALSMLTTISKDEIWNGLIDLQSVLYIHVRKPIRFIHLSFRDHLHSTAALDYCIDDRANHARLAECCLRRFETDVADLRNAYGQSTRRDDNEYFIRDELRYACRYWMLHVLGSKVVLDDDCRVHKFLKIHFLHWLDIMSWLNQRSDIIRQLRRLVLSVRGRSFSMFLEDGIRFTTYNRYVLDNFPAQLYSSALLFTPLNSIIGSSFRPTVELNCYFECRDDWLATLNLETGYGTTHAMAYSRDGNSLVTATNRIVHVWDLTTGEPRQTISHADTVDVVIFGKSDNTVLTLTKDTLRAWDIASSTVRWSASLPLGGAAVAVALSHSGDVLAISDRLGHLLQWRAHKVVQISPDPEPGTRFAFGWNPIQAVAFSKDDMLLAHGSSTEAIRIWHYYAGPTPELATSLHTSTQDLNLTTDCAPWHSIEFAADVTLIGAATAYKIYLWSTATWDLCCTINRTDTSFAVPIGIKFINHGTMLSCISADGWIRQWDTRTGEQLIEQPLEGAVVNRALISPDHDTAALILDGSSHVSVLPLSYGTRSPKDRVSERRYSSTDLIALSPSKTSVATARDTLVKLWTLHDLTAVRTLSLPTPATSLMFSPNNRSLAVMTSTRLLVWDLQTYNYSFHIVPTGSRLLPFSSSSNMLAIITKRSGIYATEVLNLQDDCWHKIDKSFMCAFASSTGRVACAQLNEAGPGCIIRLLSISWAFREDDDRSYSRSRSIMEFPTSIKRLLALTWSQSRADGYLAIAGPGAIELRSECNGQLICHFSHVPEDMTPMYIKFPLHAGYILVSQSGRTGSRIYEIPDGRLLIKGEGLGSFAGNDIILHPTWTCSEADAPKEWSGLIDLAAFTYGDSWLWCDGEKSLWLPPEYRSEAYVAFDRTIVMLGKGGGLLMFKRRSV